MLYFVALGLDFAPTQDHMVKTEADFEPSRRTARAELGALAKSRDSVSSYLRW
jgi:hypothetical protein